MTSDATARPRIAELRQQLSVAARAYHERDELLIPEIQRLHKKNYSGGLSVKRWIWDWPDRKEGQ